MSEFTQKNLEALTARGEHIVDVLVRFGLLTGNTLQKWVSNLGPDAARKSLERLAADGWLTKHNLPSGQAYYVLSNAACNRLTLKRTGAAFRQRTLVRRLLVLLHFSSHRELRMLTPADFKSALPDLYRRGGSNYFFIDSASDSLGWVCIDDGKQLKRVHSKTVHTAAKKRTIAPLREIALAGRFKLLLLTTSEAKRDELIKLFTAQPLRELKIEIQAVPECAHLLGLA